MSGDLGVRLCPEGSAKAKAEALQQARQCRAQYMEKECRIQYTVHRNRITHTVHRNRITHTVHRNRKNALQANPGRSRTHPVFVEVLCCRQEFLQQGVEWDALLVTIVLARQHGKSTWITITITITIVLARQLGKFTWRTLTAQCLRSTGRCQKHI